MKKALIILIIYTFSRQLFGQTFGDDWKTFHSNNFTISIDISKSQKWDKTTYGQLTFKNKKDKSILLKYHVFLISDTDSVFFKNIYDWYYVQSCSSMGEQFNSFVHNKFYYYKEPCDRCDTYVNKECVALLYQLKQYVSGYPK